MTEQKTKDNYTIAEAAMTDLWDFWYKELHDGVSGLTIKVNKIHESMDTGIQRLEVLENKDFGKILLLYGSLMVCDNDNNAYNEMITHVPLFVHPSPKNVLIIGGGDCGALTETLKHPEVERCTMCEIDRKVVEISQKYFPYLTEGLNDKRANLIFDDGKKYVEDSGEKFDIIMTDLSDPVGPAAELFQKPFHQEIYDHLNDDGIFVPQTESPFFNQKTVKGLYHNLKSIFPIVRMYTCFMPIYPSGLWSFAFCSKKYDPLEDFDPNRLEIKDYRTRYYNAEIHRAAFALPQFFKNFLEK